MSSNKLIHECCAGQFGKLGYSGYIIEKNNEFIHYSKNYLLSGNFWYLLKKDTYLLLFMFRKKILKFCAVSRVFYLDILLYFLLMLFFHSFLLFAFFISFTYYY